MALNIVFSVFSRNLIRNLRNEEAIRRISCSPVFFSDDNSSKKSAAEKLHSLLQDIIKDETISSDNVTKAAAEVDVVPKKIKRPEKPKNLGEKIVDSAKEVAKTLDGKPEETEAQLLHRLLYKNQPLAESITKAAGNETLNDLLSGMEIERTPTPVRKKPPFKTTEYTRADQVRSMLPKKTSSRPPRPVKPTEKVDIFGEEPLGIFKPGLSEPSVHLKTWEAMQQKEMKLLVAHPPRNIYEQMIWWTERGMLWKFPINNEQGMDEEEKVDFTKHIFLETHLEGWCPDQGPIRHFMELVCVGLSRNHWLTVEEKKQHILWYRDYFMEKKALLEELGAGEIKALTSN